MLRIIPIAMVCISASLGQAPSAPGQAPSFDVASIHSTKSVGEGRRREKIDINPGTVTMTNVSLKSAIRWAYHVMDYQVSGPDWLGSERFDIAAKSAGEPGEEQLRLMTQTLLADRFKLAFHRQTKELPAYVLLVAKGGIKFHESQQTEGEPDLKADKGRLSVEVKGVPATQFVEMLSNILHAPVINDTGLTGRYDAKVDIGKYVGDLPNGPKDVSGGGAPFDPSAMIITGLQEELGLKLESKKVPLDLLIVDHMERVPAEN